MASTNTDKSTNRATDYSVVLWAYRFFIKFKLFILKYKIMLENEIIEGKKLIANFMGMTNSFDTFFNKKESCHYEISDLKYDSDWNMLIPVLNKIAYIGLDIRMSFFGSENTFHSDICDGENEISNATNDSFECRIDLIFSNVVYFVKWHYGV